MKNNIKIVIFSITSFILGLSFVIVSYANSYNSEEINYDNSTSHASATNVKDAIDYLYSHGSCGEGMSCLESPILTITVNGPGSVNKTNLSVPINGSSILEVTPNEGYVLQKVECNGGYEVGAYKEYSAPGAESKQNIEISNTRLFDNSTCTVTFGTNEISVSSQSLESHGADNCNSNSSGCICYQIANNITNFTYGSHTGCNFISKTCNYIADYKDGDLFDCTGLDWNTYYGNRWGDRNDNNHSGVCSGVITCAT